MATYAGAKRTEVKKAASLKYGIISGTVQKSAANVRRQIIIYKSGFTTILAGDTFSDSSTGVFSAVVKAGINDRFRVICIGAEGENSVVYESVAAF